MNKILDTIANVGAAVGSVVEKIMASAKDAVKLVLETVIPFMVFISLIVGVVNYTGIGNWLANLIAPVMSNLPSMIIMSFVCVLPFLAPILAPGAAIGQVASILIGTQIAAGTIAPVYALPALFAINAQVGSDFIPVGLSLAAAGEETQNLAIPTFLFSRMITGPLAVVIAYVISATISGFGG